MRPVHWDKGVRAFLPACGALPAPGRKCLDNTTSIAQQVTCKRCLRMKVVPRV